MHNRTHRLLAILAVLAGPVGADLTTLPLETLLSTEVISASGFPQQVRDAPSAVGLSITHTGHSGYGPAGRAGRKRV
jgi:hypothetical protein